MKIEWTKPALLDLENIRNYIGMDSELYANRFIEKVIEAVEILAKFPQMGRKGFLKPMMKISVRFCSPIIVSCIEQKSRIFKF
ncbi:type II toxin-antitoxin system RelE/ParE family toxin [candidate division KSB1 bacterium]|nr:type II toxin-antitoxin system RelE/ParE family toxin [candidate division KSB1 bacterium]